MRSTSFLAFFLFALLSVVQLTLAEPISSDDLVGRDSELDIAPAGPSNSQQSFDGGITLSKSKSEKVVCPAGYAAVSAAILGSGVTAPSVARSLKMVATGRYAQLLSHMEFMHQEGLELLPIHNQGASNRYYCIKNIFGAIRCCPNGKICLFKDGTPAAKADASA
ncbi:hypothetical protein FRC10_003852 [Ceratobasidium sp. 414]|nr:hypothetical protein FRC10_003852 [Ceratobasidium sp. 414]